MARNIKFLILFTLICIFITGCIKLKTDSSINAEKVKKEVDEYYSKFSGEAFLGNIKTVNKQITGWDGEITKYIDKYDKVCRCTAIIYGESKKSTFEYYFLGDYIYVTELEEYYDYPMNIHYDRPVYVLYRAFKEELIYNDSIYQLENGYFIKTDSELPYNSLDELNEAMEE